MKLGVLSFVAASISLVSATAAPGPDPLAAAAKPYCPKVTSWRYKTTATVSKTRTVTKTVTKTKGPGYGGGGGGGGVGVTVTVTEANIETITIPTTVTLVGEPTTCYPLPASCTNRAPLVNADFEEPTLDPWTTTESGSIHVPTFDDIVYSGDFAFKFSSAPGRLEQTVSLCAGARYYFRVNYRTLVGQEECVGRIGIEGVYEELTRKDPAVDWDYVGGYVKTTDLASSEAKVFVEWSCVTGSQGVLFVDTLELYIV